MNKDRIRHMADVIEKATPSPSARYNLDEPDGSVCQSNIDHFDMSTYYSTTVNDCGTAGCIAGWTVKEYASDVGIRSESDFFYAAKDILGLSHDEAEDLFEPGADLSWQIGPENVARVLRDIADGTAIDDAWQAEIDRMGAGL